MLQESQCVKGLPVRLALGAVIDTSLGRLERPARYVADKGAPDGRRLVPASSLDDKGRPLATPPAEPKTLKGTLRGPARSPSQGDALEVIVDFEDGQWAGVGLDKLEAAGEAPAQPPPIPESAEKSLSSRVGALELAERDRLERARAANDPDKRFVTAKELDEVRRDAKRANDFADATAEQLSRVISTVNKLVEDAHAATTTKELAALALRFDELASSLKPPKPTTDALVGDGRG